MAAIAKVFKHGATQAVHLPKGFRFDANEVCVKRIGSALLLFPKNAAWDLMADALGKVDQDFMMERRQPRQAKSRTT